MSDSFVKYAEEGYELCSLTITSLVDGFLINGENAHTMHFWKNERLLIPKTYSDSGFYVYNTTSKMLNVSNSWRLETTGNVSEISMLTSNQNQMRDILTLSLNVFAGSYQSFVLYPYIFKE